MSNWNPTTARAKAMDRLEDQNKALRARVAELTGLLKELRIRLHVTGRRPEECYEMSLIDAALAKEGE